MEPEWERCFWLGAQPPALLLRLNKNERISDVILMPYLGMNDECGAADFGCVFFFFPSSPRCFDSAVCVTAILEIMQPNVSASIFAFFACMALPLSPVTCWREMITKSFVFYRLIMHQYSCVLTVSFLQSVLSRNICDSEWLIAKRNNQQLIARKIISWRSSLVFFSHYISL